MRQGFGECEYQAWAGRLRRTVLDSTYIATWANIEANRIVSRCFMEQCTSSVALVDLCDSDVLRSDVAAVVLGEGKGD